MPAPADYERVEANASDQVLGANGLAGDFLLGLLVTPATLSPGAISIKDGRGDGITVFVGGASSVSNLVPFFIPINAKSCGGPWKITTGADVAVLAVGKFTR